MEIGEDQGPAYLQNFSAIGAAVRLQQATQNRPDRVSAAHARSHAQSSTEHNSASRPPREFRFRWLKCSRDAGQDYGGAESKRYVSR